MNKLLLFFCLLTISFMGYTQEKSPWKKVNKSDYSFYKNHKELENDLIFNLNEADFKQSLTILQGKSSKVKGTKILIPNNKGILEEFEVKESSNFAPELQATYPDIRAYSGIGITDPSASIYFSVSPDGIKTMVLRGDADSEFIDPYRDDKSMYVVSTSKNRSKGELPLSCKTRDVALNKALVNKSNALQSNSGVFKTLRLALSCTGEYAAYFGGTIAGALAAMNATMTRVNGVFNKDLAVRLEIIANNNLVVYTNAVTDPYSNPAVGIGDENTDGAWNLELQSTLTSVIGNGAYDIGHLFAGSGGGGNAGCIGCVCEDPTFFESDGKGSGYTSPSNGEPEGDLFDIDFVAHEMGHQLGATHTFSYVIEGTGTNVEPGSGSTIMSYAGITDFDVQDHSDDYFTYASILQIQENIDAKSSCGVNTTLTNQTPVVNAGSDYTIPKSTAFLLKGTGSDPNGGALTYCWEQLDSAINQDNEDSVAFETKPNGPNFRSFLPTNSPDRYMPSYNAVLAGRLSSTWESVSSVNRTLHFTLTGRNNATIGLGQTSTDEMKVIVNENIGPFAITSPNSLNFNWIPGDQQTINWSVNNSNTLAGSANVNIKLSTDDGLTFPIVLAANTPNDGSEVIIAPAIYAKNCRILIEPTGNIYYAINSNPFVIGYNTIYDCTSYTFETPFPILELSTYIEKKIIVPATTAEVKDVNLNLGFTHNFLSDLEIEIMSPKGTTVKLFNRECNTNGSLLLKYDDLGGILSCAETKLQTIIPFESLSAFNGENPEGVWTLRVRDKFPNDTGTFNSASITICSQSFTAELITSAKVFENPNNGNFDIQFFSKPDNGIVKVTVYDVSGNLIYKKEFENKVLFNENIQLENVSTGVYFVIVSDNARNDKIKIIVK